MSDDLGRTLEEVMLAAGMSRAHLSRHLGVHPATVGRAITGERNVTRRLVMEWLTACDVRTDQQQEILARYSFFEFKPAWQRIDKDELDRLYSRQQWPIDKIVKYFHCRPSTLYQALQAHNMPLRRQDPTREPERISTATITARRELTEKCQTIPSSLIDRVTRRRALMRLLPFIARGLSSRDIGSRLYLSEQTIKAETRMLCGLLGAANRTHLIAIAYELGLLVPTHRHCTDPQKVGLPPPGTQI